jgi:lysozyme
MLWVAGISIAVFILYLFIRYFLRLRKTEAKNLSLSSSGLDLIKKFEGLVLSAYQDSGGVWTIGYGHAINVQPGTTINKQEAESLLKADTQSAQDTVKKMVTVPINQNQFDSLVSFVYNVGSGNFQRSSVLRELNAGNYESAANELLKWNKDSQYTVLAGLEKRRNTEKNLFLA